MPVWCKTSSFSSAVGATAGTGTAGAALVGTGAAMHFGVAWAGAARAAGIAGAFRPADQASVPAVQVGLPHSVPDLAVPVVDRPELDRPAPGDLVPWRVPAAEGRVDQAAAAAAAVVGSRQLHRMA